MSPLVNRRPGRTIFSFSTATVVVLLAASFFTWFLCGEYGEVWAYSGAEAAEGAFAFIFNLWGVNSAFVDLV